ncbi:MAG: ABC transporter permease subunit [Clostridia bacterium]|nr:ABC transporter permease subunit [Clostridia bacterium]
MLKKSGLKLWAVLLWLIVWQLASMAVGKEILLVSPIRTITRLAELASALSFWKAILYTLSRIALGFTLATALGVLLAILSSRFSSIRDICAPAMLTIKTIPVASFIIVALIWFSSKKLSILISFLMVLPIIYTNTLNGILAADPQLIEMARVFRIPVFRQILYVYGPQVLPYFRTGCTLALGLSWKSGVAAEVIGMPVGSIGERLQQAKVYLDTPDLFAWTLTIILVSLLFERGILFLLHCLERRLTHIGSSECSTQLTREAV